MPAPLTRAYTHAYTVTRVQMLVTLGCSLVSVDKDKPMSQKGSDRWVAAVMVSLQTHLGLGRLDSEFFIFMSAGIGTHLYQSYFEL